MQRFSNSINMRSRVRTISIVFLFALISACASLGGGGEAASWVGRRYEDVAERAGKYAGFARVGNTLAAVYFCRCDDGHHDLDADAASDSTAASEPVAVTGASPTNSAGAASGSGADTAPARNKWCRDVRYVLYVQPDGTVQSVRDWRTGAVYPQKR